MNKWVILRTKKLILMALLQNCSRHDHFWKPKVELKLKEDEDPVRMQSNDIINCSTLIL